MCKNTCYKKIIFFVLLLLSVNVCFGQLWGADFYIGRRVKQDQKTWCVFACVEMKTQKVGDKCKAATMYARMFNDTEVDCCQQYPDDNPDEEFNNYCLHGTDLMKASYFLSQFHGGVPVIVNKISDAFEIGNPNIYYPFPGYGFINNLSHCVLVYGIKGEMKGIQKTWTVYFVDPDKANLDKLELTENDSRMELLFIR